MNIILRRLLGSLWTIVSLLVVVGCNSPTKKEQATAPVADPTYGVDLDETCDGRTARGASQVGDKINGLSRDFELFPSYVGNERGYTLCEALGRNDVAIFQFAGLLCKDCMEKAEAFDAQMSRGQYRGIAHYVVFTEAPGQNRESDYDDWMGRYARTNTSRRLHDLTNLAWRSFSNFQNKNRQKSPDLNTIVVMNRNMDAFVYTEKVEISRVLSDAVALFRAANGSATNINRR